MKRIGLAWVVCFGLMSPGTVTAVNWLLASEAVVASEYNDNLRLAIEDHEKVWSRHVDLDMLVSGATPKSDFRLHPHYRVSRFSSAAVQDNDIAEMEMATRLFGERVASELSLDWRRDTTLTSELEDTGLIQATKHRTVRGAHPSIRYAISERMDGQLRWNVTDVAYQDAARTALTDYRYESLSGTLVFRRSLLDSVQADVYGSRLDAPEIGNQVVDVGMRASLTHAFYERTYGAFTIGAHRVMTAQELPGPDFHSTRHGFLGDVTLTQERITTSWTVRAQRTIEPSGYGLLVQNDRVDAKFSERLNPYWSIGLGGLYLRNDALQSLVAFDARRYARLTTRVFWSFSRAWQLSMRYSRQWQRFASASREAESNELGAVIAYRFDKKTLYP